MNQTRSDRWTPRSTVAAVVEQDDKFLIVKERIKGEIRYNQPAGHLEPNERFTDAVCRETLEETGWVVEPTNLLGLYVYLTDDKTLTFHRLCFIAKPVELRADALLDPEILEVLWLTRDEIAARKAQLRSHLVLECIDDYLAGTRYPLSVINDQVFQTVDE